MRVGERRRVNRRDRGGRSAGRRRPILHAALLARERTARNLSPAQEAALGDLFRKWETLLLIEPPLLLRQTDQFSLDAKWNSRVIEQKKKKKKKKRTERIARNNCCKKISNRFVKCVCKLKVRNVHHKDRKSIKWPTMPLCQ